MHESLQSQFDLSGKAAIVTGASRGLGVAFARGLAKAGSNLLLAARTGDELQDRATELAAFGVQVEVAQIDISQPDEVVEMVDSAVAAFGRLDILVNNAGISAVAEAENLSDDQWDDIIETNLSGLFRCAREAGKVMLKQGHGKIINIASQYGIVASSYVCQASYVASKTGVLGLTRELAVEWAPRGLHVTALAPGFFPSDQTVWAFKDGQELGQKLLKKIPMGRMGRLEELEATIVYMASPASDYMNGQALVLDGGFLSW